jgi:hypothetical protein
VGPRLVCEVEFTEWTTRSGELRHPSFKGMRWDKAAEEVMREVSNASRDCSSIFMGRPSAIGQRSGHDGTVIAAEIWESVALSRDRLQVARGWPRLTSNAVAIGIQTVRIRWISAEHSLGVGLISEVGAIVSVALADVSRGVKLLRSYLCRTAEDA